MQHTSFEQQSQDAEAQSQHPFENEEPTSEPQAEASASTPSDWLAILRRYWGYPAFRSIQLSIIESISAGHDTLGLMPTGGGKSLTFQVPTMGMEGMCIVVTPLIALMKDQVQNLRRRGIPAEAVYAGLSRAEVVQRLDNAIFGAYKFLYVSPERLATSLFQSKLRGMKVCLITVDEAHCISQWGYDFRPHYLQIATIRNLLPNIPILALTATATPLVVKDIQEKLDFRNGQVFRMSFERPNLHYIVRQAEDKIEQLIHILRSVSGSAIVYTRSRKRTREVAEILNQSGLPALYYHAGLTSLDKDMRQLSWQSDETRIMVATNAFGMGIDKPDVRLVVHIDVPDSLEAYYQEAGRGGRDGAVSYAVLLYNRSDIQKLNTRLSQTFPERSYIRRVYSDLASFYQIAEGDAEGRTFDFDIDRFCRVFKHFPVVLVSALNLLTRAGYIHFSLEGETGSRIMFLVRRDELYGVDYLDAHEERVLNALLRTHCGFFSDYVPVEEDRIAEECHLTREEVYDKLRHMTQLRVVNYIPGKSVPQITYISRRIDSNLVEISPDIYERRLEQYKTRIDAMLGYFTQTDTCRSRYLLHYFADEGPDCGYCDVCISREEHIQSLSAEKKVKSAEAYLLDFLASIHKEDITTLNNQEDGKKTEQGSTRSCTLSQLQQSGYPAEILQRAIQYLTEQGKIRYEGFTLELL